MTLRKSLAVLGIVLLIVANDAFAGLSALGLLNGLNNSVDLTVQYTSGRTIDRHLKTHEAVVTGSAFGEGISRIEISARGRPKEIVLESTIRNQAPRRGGPWLYITGHASRVISSDERVQIMRTW